MYIIDVRFWPGGGKFEFIVLLGEGIFSQKSKIFTRREYRGVILKLIAQGYKEGFFQILLYAFFRLNIVIFAVFSSKGAV